MRLRSPQYRFPMPVRFPVVAAAAVLLLAAAVPGAAAEAGHTVDITLAQNKGTCTALDVPVGAAPPSPVRIESGDVSFDCSGSIDFRLGRDTRFAFDDAKGTATADVLRIVGVKHGFTCGYEATRVVFHRDGASREYRGGPYRGKKVQGSFLCPRSVQLDRAAFSFN